MASRLGDDAIPADRTVLRSAPRRMPQADADATVLRDPQDLPSDSTVLRRLPRRAPEQTADATVLRERTPGEEPSDATVLRAPAVTTNNPEAPNSGSEQPITQPQAPEWLRRAPAGAATKNRPRYERPVEIIEAPPAPKPWRKITILFVATITVAVLAGVGYVRFIHRQSIDPTTQVSQSAKTEGPQFTRADQLVRSYLAALAAGDSETAKSLGGQGSGDPAAITKDAYARSLAQYPISQIRVAAAGENPSSVEASYQLGDQPVTTRMRVSRTADGSWQLARSTVEIALTNRAAPELPVRLNDEPISSGVAELLPGHYVVSSGLPYIDYPEDNSLTITNLDYVGRVERELTPTITPEGRDALLNAARASIDRCLQAKTLNPAGCPNQLAAGKQYQPETVRWSLINDPFQTTVPALDSTDPTRGQATMLLKFQVSFSFADGSTNGEQLLDATSASVSASLLIADDDQIEVQWR